MKNTEASIAPSHGQISLHTLNVWTPLVGVMKSWFWAMNTPTDQFVQGQIWIPQNTKPYSDEQICAIVKSREQKISFCLNDGKGNNFTLRGGVTLLIPVMINPTGWIMGIEGTISTHDSAEVPVTMPVYYDTEYGRGFCLIPQKIGYQIAGHGY